MNTSIVTSSLVAVIGTTAEFSWARGVPEPLQLVILGVTLLAFSTALRFGRRAETI